jgi:hypothetical protein
MTRTLIYGLTEEPGHNYRVLIVDSLLDMKPNNYMLLIELSELPESAKQGAEMYSGIGSFKEHPTKEQVIHVLRWLGGDEEVEPPNYG